MQTFLLDLSHQKTASMLDMSRLGKQRVESIQLMDVLLRKSGLLDDGKNGFSNHPVILYWFEDKTKQNYLPALIAYTDLMIEEWIKRGYNNTISTDKWKTVVNLNPSKFNFDSPPWQSKATGVINSHRARVLQKNYDYYSVSLMTAGINIPEGWQEAEYLWMRPTIAQAKKLKALTT